MSLLIDGRAEFGCSLEAWANGVAPMPYAGLMPRAAQRLEVTIPDIGVIADNSERAIARANHGRWVVDCPCGSVSMVWIDRPLLWCMACGNADIDHQWRRVELPDPEQRDAIEQALIVRPLENRNWDQPETVQELLAENAEHEHELTQVIP